MEKNQRFKALSKICLNNWHYIDRKILTFSSGVNFFTGHSGSGKSTVIDALQLVLYANTDGRGFFNKAAADDSDRSLIEYLRGMVNIGDNNESQYLRNRNFSSTVVLELEERNAELFSEDENSNADLMAEEKLKEKGNRGRNRQKECVGVVFDVDTSTNEVGRLFFWHRGGLLENQYRADRRCLTTAEVREYLQRTFEPSDFYCGPSNERFRKQLYDIYLGGLDMEKFPKLFKRAIPFRMNIRLEDFVKEYICMEQDIHIEDMQESVMQYGRMRGKIEETMKEIRHLQDIREKYEEYEKAGQEAEACSYQIRKLEIMQLESREQELKDRMEAGAGERSRLETMQSREEKRQEALQKEYEEVLLRIADSGYSTLEKDLISLNETLDRLYGSRGKWQKTSEGLAAWKQEEVTPNQTVWDIESFEKQNISAEHIQRLKDELDELRGEMEQELKDTESRLRGIKKEEKAAREELKELRQGRKAYPRELEEARYELRTRLKERCGKFVQVQILADMLDVPDEKWHNAVEGYLGSSRLLLVVEPEWVKTAMEIWQEMDVKSGRAALLDTEKVLEKYGRDKRAGSGAEIGRGEKNGGAEIGQHPTDKTDKTDMSDLPADSLAREVTAKDPCARAYIDFFLGNVIKCTDIDELRRQKIGITPDCILYQGFRLRRINPELYTRQAYIGETSLRQRIRGLEERCQELQDQRLPLQEQRESLRRILQLESLPHPADEYMEWKKDLEEITTREKRKNQIIEEMKKLQTESVSVWEEKKREILEEQGKVKENLQKLAQNIWKNKDSDERNKKVFLDIEEELKEKQKDFQKNEKYEKEFEKYLDGRRSSNWEYLRQQRMSEYGRLENARNCAFSALADRRTLYLKNYPNRNFSATIQDNVAYDRLYDSLNCDELEEYRKAAGEQARSAVEHFKDDFIFKIRSAIREAYQKKDELNRILERLDFGKDRYQFVITRNKGPDGKYYKMFMDDALSIDPAQLTGGMENQLNMFTMEHEQEYGELMNELINIFIPPENATQEELEQAKRNMDKYADYRTYLSFDMQQIIHGEKDMKIGLSKMIRKNSGGEGQNPLYVALLASFAQLYHVNEPARSRRHTTIRLVVLDEAFSKMDAEKVASCISLIRGLGFQAIISATNDKIQNYLENVDKTFVFANPNKKHISIQEFEREEYGQLKGES